MTLHRRLECRSCEQRFYQRYMLTGQWGEYRLACPSCQATAAYLLPGEPDGRPTGKVGTASEAG